MSRKVAPAQPLASSEYPNFDYELMDTNPDCLRTVGASLDQKSAWIEPAKLKLRHRIGRGPFGDVWLATHHESAEEFDEHHEVAVKMFQPIKEDDMKSVLDKHEEIYLKCQGIEGLCRLHGTSIINGKICIAMKLYEGSVGDKMAQLKGGKLSLLDVLSLQNEVGDVDWTYVGNRVTTEKSSSTGYTEWFLSQDRLLVGDIVRSRKTLNSCKPENMDVPQGTVVGIEHDMGQHGFVLVKVHGIHDPLRVHVSTLERVTLGLAAGDWIRLKKQDKNHSPISILHSIDRDGNVAVGFIGSETLWKGTSSEFQMTESYCVGRFVRLKGNVLGPRFEWPRKTGGKSATGKIWWILPNGCLVVKFPGMLTLDHENATFLADPTEVESVTFDTCPGMVKKYQHLEDHHWAVRPVLIALGIFTAMKMGIFVGSKIGKCKVKKRPSTAAVQDESHVIQEESHIKDSKNSRKPGWKNPVTKILFGDGGTSAR